VLLSADAMAQKVNGFDPKKTIVTDETARPCDPSGSISIETGNPSSSCFK
jgi:hypothetical protein